MPAVIHSLVIGLVVAGGLATAAAAPATDRVVLADTDPELQRAVATALLPWKLEVIVSSDVPVDTAGAMERAEAQAARFVVWRDGDDLVVYDRAASSTEHRVAPAGALDPVSAAAAALTVKTLMRLPPLPEAGVVVVPVTTDERDLEIRVQAGFDTRFARGSSTDNDVSARFVGAVMVRPWRFAIRFGVAADLGSNLAIERMGFKGSWTDWNVVGLASWTYAIGTWEIEPYVGGGAVRSSLAGVEMQTARDDTATLAIVRGGVWVRRRFALFTVGAAASADGILGTPTYTRMGGNNQTLFDVPSIAASFGLVAAADFGR